jgi:hypothetical protein
LGLYSGKWIAGIIIEADHLRHLCKKEGIPLSFFSTGRGPGRRDGRAGGIVKSACTDGMEFKLGKLSSDIRRETMSENNLENSDQTVSASEAVRLKNEINQLDEEINNVRKNDGGRGIEADSWIELVSIVVLGIMVSSFTDLAGLGCLLTIIGMIAWLIIIFRRMDQKDKKYQEEVEPLERKLARKKFELRERLEKQEPDGK